MARTATATQKQSKKKQAVMEAEPIAAPHTPAGMPKNFRQQADIESFFRFVYENDLRVEALEIIDETRAMKMAAKKAKAKVKH